MQVQSKSDDIRIKSIESSKRSISFVDAFLLLAIFFLPILLFAQKPIVALTIDKKEVSPNERVTITVTSNIESSMEIVFPQEFAVDYGIVNGMEQKSDPTGKLRTYYYMQQSGVFKRSGTFAMYAFINHKGKVYKSNKLTVTIEDNASDLANEQHISSGDPVFGIIESNKAVVYEGEPFVVGAKVFSRLQILKMEGYAPFEPEKNTEEFSLPNNQSAIEQTKINGRPALTFEIGKQLIFPITSGKVRIAPFEMALRCDAGMFPRSFRFRSSSLTIMVKALPLNAPKSFIKAVGKFDVTAHVAPTKLKQGDFLTYELTISGSGNLHAIKTPDLFLPSGISQINTPTKVADIEYSELGATGKVTFTYNLQLTDSGKVTIGKQAITYFDPAKDAYVLLKTTAFQLDVASNKTFIATADQPKPLKNSLSISPKTTKATSQKAQEKSNSIPVLVGIITPITLLGLFFLLFFVRKRKTSCIQPCSESQGAQQRRSSKMNYWEQLMGDDVDNMKCAILLPKAIVQQVDELYACSFGTRDKAFDQLAASHPFAAERLREIIDTCDHFRYGLGTEDMDVTALIEESIEILSHLDN